MKTREVQCVNYEAEGHCSLGKEGTFYGYCQHCHKYEAKAGARPARENTKYQRLERARRKEHEAD